MNKHRILMIVFMTAAVFVMNVGIGTAEDVDLTLEGHFGGGTYATAVSGDYAYVGQEQDLVVLDISNPSQPLELGRIDTLSFVEDIKISGSYAYVANWNNGLMILHTDASGTDATPYADVIMMSTSLDLSTAVNTPTAFALAATNVGSASATDVSLTVEVSSSITGLSYQVNETNPDGSIKGPATGLTIPVGDLPTFAFFLTPSELISFDPANNRIMLKLVDGNGKLVGAQSVAISTI